MQTGSGYPGNGNCGTAPQPTIYIHQTRVPVTFHVYFNEKLSPQTSILSQSALGRAIVQYHQGVHEKSYMYLHSEPEF